MYRVYTTHGQQKVYILLVPSTSYLIGAVPSSGTEVKSKGNMNQAFALALPCSSGTSRRHHNSFVPSILVLHELPFPLHFAFNLTNRSSYNRLCGITGSSQKFPNG
jgi:hypothetical protein